MTTTSIDPPASDEPAVDQTGADRPGVDSVFARRRRTARTTGVIACVGMVLSLLGVAALIRPLSTPVQDCGTASSFLLRGGANQYVDPADPPKGVTKIEAEANNELPCQERAANRARPAGLLILAGALVTIIALFTEWILRLRWHRANVRR